MPTLDNDYWHLQCEVRYVRKRNDVYEIKPCDDSYHALFAINDTDECPKCHNTGFMQIKLPYPKAPQIPDVLLKHLTAAYNEWVKNNVPGDINCNI